MVILVSLVGCLFGCCLLVVFVGGVCWCCLRSVIAFCVLCFVFCVPLWV